MIELATRNDLLDHIGIEGKTCVEVGVCTGVFSDRILQRRPKMLFLVDSWCSPFAKRSPGMGPQGFLATSLKFKGNPFVKILHKSSMDASLDFEDRCLDFAFIDANHSYDYVLSDLFLWYPKVKKGGWIAGHDYQSSGHPDVQPAAEAFVKVSGETIEIVTAEHHGTFAIRRTKD